MPYDPTLLVQDYTFTWVRDELGVDAETLPDSYLAGLPQAIVIAKATRLVPTWASLTEQQRADFDIALTLEFCIKAIQRLKTLYAPGEGASDARGGQYDWTAREADLCALADAYWNRAQAETSTTPNATYIAFRAWGASRAAGFRSPSAFRCPADLAFPPGFRASPL